MAEAANGEEGLAMIEEHKPDIVLADIVMPVLDGMDFSVIVKKRFPQVRLIILSSYDDFEYVKKTLLSGACDYVLKPSLNPQELLGVLGRTAAMIPGMYLEKKLELSVTEKLSRYLNGYEANFTEGDFLIQNAACCFRRTVSGRKGGLKTGRSWCALSGITGKNRKTMRPK